MLYLVIVADGFCLMQCMPASDNAAGLSVTGDSSVHATRPRAFQCPLTSPRFMSMTFNIFNNAAHPHA